jgi:very-short-patch-repair endonuclease
VRHAARGHGSEHGGDPEAYRRDRRKDQLLQEHGYFVRRFLAEDVRKCFDQVLDPILRVFRRKLATAARPPLMG